jgi:hypothetical protein
MTCEEYVIKELENAKSTNKTLTMENETLMELHSKFERLVELIKKYAEVEPEKLYLSIYGWRIDKEERQDFKDFIELCGLEVKENEDEPSSIDG